MDALLARCLFAREAQVPRRVTVHRRDKSNDTGDGDGNDADVRECVDMAVLQSYVARGRAVLRPAGAFVSVCVREGSQTDVCGLPCGARSLLIDGDSGAIVVRGMNKFVDVADVSSSGDGDAATAWVHDPATWQRSRAVWALRKMAGFVVIAFSHDGVTLSLMSKHALAGRHVDMARRVCDAQLTATQQRRIAADLHAWRATLACECMAAEDAAAHPLPERASRYRDVLVALSVQRAHCVQEQTLPMTRLRRVTARWGLLCAPAVRMTGSADVVAALCATRPWHARYCAFARSSDKHDKHNNDNNNNDSSKKKVTSDTGDDVADDDDDDDEAVLGEGLVLLLELPTDEYCSGDEDSDDDEQQQQQHCTWVRPVRVKAKTTRYVVLRTLRSVLAGEQSSSLSSPSSPSHLRARVYMYNVALLAWAVDAHGAASLVQRSRSDGVYALHRRFAAALAAASRRRRRHRNADSCVGDAYATLLRLAADEVADVTRHVVAEAERRQVQAEAAAAAAAKEEDGAVAVDNNNADKHNDDGGGDVRHCPLTVLLMCGLPGAGKTTLTRELLHRLTQSAHCVGDIAAAPCPFAFAVHLARDAVHAAVVREHYAAATAAATTATVTTAAAMSTAAMLASLSQHRQRRMRSAVHHRVCAAVRDVVRYTRLRNRCGCHRRRSSVAATGADEEAVVHGLLVVDACNASRATRAAWRRLLPPLHALDGVHIVYVTAGDTAALLRRVMQRTQHDVLACGDEVAAARALYAVQRRFAAPLLHDDHHNNADGDNDDDAAAVVAVHHCDAAAYTPAQLVQQLLPHIMPLPPCRSAAVASTVTALPARDTHMHATDDSGGSGAMRCFDVESLGNALADAQTQLLVALLGERAGARAAVDAAVSAVLHEAHEQAQHEQQRGRRRQGAHRVVAVQLDADTAHAVRDAVTRVLATLLLRPSSQPQQQQKQQHDGDEVHAVAADDKDDGAARSLWQRMRGVLSSYAAAALPWRWRRDGNDAAAAAAAACATGTREAETSARARVARCGVDGVVVAGHCAWLRGWLLAGGGAARRRPAAHDMAVHKATANVTTTAATAAAMRSAVARALDDRFDGAAHRPHASSLHITLLYAAACAGDAADARVRDFYTHTGLSRGARVCVEWRELLLDRAAMCGGVAVCGVPVTASAASPSRAPPHDGAVDKDADALTWRTVQWTCGSKDDDNDDTDSSTPLHMTLGTTHNTQPHYTASMFARFVEMQRWNEALQARRQEQQQQQQQEHDHATTEAATATSDSGTDAVRRSRDKFHNFVRVRLTPPLRLVGTVTDCTTAAAHTQRTRDAYMQSFTDTFARELVELYELDGSADAVQQLTMCIEAGVTVWGQPLALPDPLSRDAATAAP